MQATLGHSSLQVTERYSRAREGVALRAGAALDQMLGEADAPVKKKAGDPASETKKRKTTEMARGPTHADLNGPLMARPQNGPDTIGR